MKMKGMEEEQIYWATRGVFALAMGGIAVGGQVSVGAGGGGSGGEDVIPTICKG